MRSPTDCRNVDSFDMMPSRSRKADTRGANYVRIIPQNSNFIYNKFIKIVSHLHCTSPVVTDGVRKRTICQANRVQVLRIISRWAA